MNVIIPNKKTDHSHNRVAKSPTNKFRELEQQLIMTSDRNLDLMTHEDEREEKQTQVTFWASHDVQVF